MRYDENYDHVLDYPANILKFEDLVPSLPNSSTNRYRGKTKLNPFLYTDSGLVATVEYRVTFYDKSVSMELPAEPVTSL